MVKRTSTGNASRPAKAPKVLDEQAVLTQLLSGEKLPADCRDMMKAALPHALSTPPESRHEFQKQMIDVVVKICNERESRNQGAVNESKSEIASLESQRMEASAKVEAAVALAAAKNDEKKAKDTAEEECQAAIKAATALLESEQAKAKSLVDEKEVVIAQRTEHEEALNTVWEPLKTSTFEGVWQKRNKAVVRIVGMIEKAGAPPSLTGALGVVLKQKAEARSTFAPKAIEHGEAMLKDHIAALSKKIESIDTQSTEVGQSTEAAEAALKAAEAKLEVAQNESIAAQNAWADDESSAVLAKDAVDQLRIQAEEAAANLASAESVLASFLELKSKFDNFKDHVKVAVEEDDKSVAQTPSKAGDALTPSKVEEPALVEA